MDPIARGERTLARELLKSLPAESARVAIETFRSAGVILPARTTIEDAIVAYESRELQLIDRYTRDLEAQFFGETEEELTYSARIRAITKLVEIAPKRVTARSDETIDVLADIALRLATDSPAESRRPEISLRAWSSPIPQRQRWRSPWCEPRTPSGPSSIARVSTCCSPLTPNSRTPRSGSCSHR